MLPSVLFTRTGFQRSVLALCLAIAFATIPTLAQNPSTPKPNYDLAAQWTSEKVSKIVFDTSVTPRWLESGERFWYTYQTRDGRKFYLVDPARKTRAPLFDHAKMAATLTAMIGQPYETQHLPFSNVRFVNKDTAFTFDVQVPRDLVINAKPTAAKPKITTEPDTSAASDDGDAALAADGDDQQQHSRNRNSRSRNSRSSKWDSAASRPAAEARPRSRRGPRRSASSTTWRPARWICSTTTTSRRAARGGRSSHPTRRPFFSRAITTCT